MTKEQFETICKSNKVCHVRISSIDFTNFRNIEHGHIDFPNSDIEAFNNLEPSILGLYGQNGSGKTSVIMALNLLKNLLSGTPIDPVAFGSCIMYGHERCSLKFSFSMIFIIEGIDTESFTGIEKEFLEAYDSSKYRVEYSFDLIRENDKTNRISGKEDKLVIENESLAVKETSLGEGLTMPKQVLFDTSFEVSDKFNHAFGNKAKYRLFTKNSTDARLALNKLKAVTRSTGLSFLFCPQFLEYLVESPSMDTFVDDLLDIVSKIVPVAAELRDKYSDLESLDNLSEDEMDALSDKIQRFPSYLARLRELSAISAAFTILYWFPMFGKNYLHVIETSMTGMTNLNQRLPLLLWNRNGNSLLSTTFMLNMDGPSEVTEKSYPQVKRAIMAISLALSKIVPEVSLQIVDLGKTTGIREELHRFEIESLRGDVPLPLKYESDGIRRIVSVLSLLIAAYNQQTFTIAIDEIDSGIFEYLLGEILDLIGKSAKGQLIFTSHNLRPLEVLPAKYLCFTTVNAKNRFTSLKKRGNSNLRDCYFRNIVLGSNGDSIYHPTDQYEIEVAFLLAGKKDGNS